jgi:hypothetical protein
MKVIASTESGFLLDATQDEVANLLGLHSKWSKGATVKPGDVLEISKIYRTFYEIRCTDKHLGSHIEDLKRCAQALETIQTSIIHKTAANLKEQE